MSSININFTDNAAGFGNTAIAQPESVNGETVDHYEMNVFMFADPAFSEWAAAAAASGSELDQYLASAYSDYALAVQLDLTRVNGVDLMNGDTTGYGFCLQDVAVVNEKPEPTITSQTISNRAIRFQDRTDTTTVDRNDTTTADGSNTTTDCSTNKCDTTVDPNKEDATKEEPTTETTTETTTNADGTTTTTTTETKADGSSTTVEQNDDGSYTKTETDEDGNVTKTEEVTVNDDGSTTKTETDASGNTTTTTKTDNGDGTFTAERTEADGSTTTTTTSRDSTGAITTEVCDFDSSGVNRDGLCARTVTSTGELGVIKVERETSGDSKTETQIARDGTIETV